MTKIQVMLGLAAVALAGGLVLALNAPIDALQGEFSRIMHLHVPASWLAFLAFGVTAVASIMWRIRRTRAWDRRAAASAEIGVLFTALSLATGSLWGGAVWGTYWDWADPRIATTALMFFVYLGYLALRSASPDAESAAARSSILGIIAVVQVPLVYFSVNMFRSLHQGQSIRPDGATMPGGMLVAMLVNVGVFTLVYFALLAARTDVMRQEEAARALEPAAGEAVRPPRFDEVPDV
ncbi:MAG TPA: cytochrome c biogenesis protein CcsA [Acidimicrobiia bacterium]|jgi:heme exporter protein C|nr:cytochrome c biogenesis protein CcsA [Acidimicrobiia bacterium]